MTNFLGIDFGQRRVGLALGNDQARLAEPLSVLVNDDQLMGNIKKIVIQHRIDQLVVGLPRGLDGQETKQTKIVRDFAVDHFNQLDLSIHWQDEALTSEVARQKIPAPVDAGAAAIILQDFLNSL